MDPPRPLSRSRARLGSPNGYEGERNPGRRAFPAFGATAPEISQSQLYRTWNHKFDRDQKENSADWNTSCTSAGAPGVGSAAIDQCGSGGPTSSNTHHNKRERRLVLRPLGQVTTLADHAWGGGGGQLNTRSVDQVVGGAAASSDQRPVSRGEQRPVSRGGAGGAGDLGAIVRDRDRAIGSEREPPPELTAGTATAVSSSTTTSAHHHEPGLASSSSMSALHAGFNQLSSNATPTTTVTRVRSLETFDHSRQQMKLLEQNSHTTVVRLETLAGGSCSSSGCSASGRREVQHLFHAARERPSDIGSVSCSGVGGGIGMKYNDMIVGRPTSRQQQRYGGGGVGAGSERPGSRSKERRPSSRCGIDRQNHSGVILLPSIDHQRLGVSTTSTRTKSKESPLSAMFPGRAELLN